MRQRFHTKFKRLNRSAQTLVEYSLLLSMISLIAISGLEELGVHIKGATADAACSMVWAKYNISGSDKTNQINLAWTEINTTLNNSFGSSSSEQKMKAKVLAKQSKMKTNFLSH